MLSNLIIILFCSIFPMVMTYMDLQYQPLYAFCWCTFGFAALAMLGAKLLLPDFKPYLDSPTNPHVEKSGREILEEMKKLGMKAPLALERKATSAQAWLFKFP